MKSIYFKNFAATAVMVMFSFLILGAAFVFLGRSYVISEYRDNMVSNAEEVSHAAQALVRDGELSNWDLRMVISTLAQSTGNHIFITDTDRTHFDADRNQVIVVDEIALRCQNRLSHDLHLPFKKAHLPSFKQLRPVSSPLP